MADLTDAELREYLELAERATPPPWELRPYGGTAQGVRCLARPRPDLIEQYPENQFGEAFREEKVFDAWCVREADLQFAARSRTIGPAAAREVLRLRELLNRYRIEPDRCEQFPNGERCGLKAGHEGKCRWSNGD